MPTMKQKLAFKKTIENYGNVSKSMREVGYSKESAKNPGPALTKTKGWQQLLKQYMPEDLIAKKHLALLNKEEYITKNNMITGEIDVIPTGQIDVQAVKSGLDMYYKVQGKYQKENPTTAIQVNIKNIREEFEE